MPDRSNVETILVINSGSSSLKFGVYSEQNNTERALFEGIAVGIGQSSGKIYLKNAAGQIVRSEDRRLNSEDEALGCAADWLAEVSSQKPSMIGHRVVSGGPRLVTHQRITPTLINELRSCIHFAPLHIPVALKLIEKSTQLYPEADQFACFDTSFHKTIPEVASRFALPRELFEEGIYRYGFHGLSYESVVSQMGANLPSRTVIAHLGSGASVVALKDGRSIDTTMGLTPTSGIPMSTRSGDLDPGILLYLLRTKKMNVDSLEKLLNEKAGLKALSGRTGDMHALIDFQETGDKDAKLAVDIFCMSVRKVIGAYAAVLGGVDTVIFSGGIGEKSAFIRKHICKDFSFLGLSMGDSENQMNRRIISTSESKVQVCIITSQEDLQIALHCRNLATSKTFR
jgi:acetate kinase